MQMFWEFAQLEQQTFTLYKQRVDIANDVLFSALVCLLEVCKKQIK